MLAVNILFLIHGSMISWGFLAITSHFFVLELVYNCKERGGESSVVGVVGCECLIGWDFFRFLLMLAGYY